MRQLLEPIWPFYATIRVLVIFLDIALLFIALYAAAEVYKHRPRFVHDPRKPPAKKAQHKKEHRFPGILEEWKKIETKLASGSPDSARLAVIEADGVVDLVLKKLGYHGETFADRLARLKATETPSVDGVWAAHRVRNDLVHTPGFKITPEKARELVGNYEAFLRAMKVLAAPAIEDVEAPARPVVVPRDD